MEVLCAYIRNPQNCGEPILCPNHAHFDFIVCRAAFKNFGHPLGALREMHRVLRPGDRALVIAMRNDATGNAIKDETAKMQLSRIDAFLT
jgi:ubiquinone/menaquinone biosynthesis C-methylase UbiE